MGEKCVNLRENEVAAVGGSEDRGREEEERKQRAAVLLDLCHNIQRNLDVSAGSSKPRAVNNVYTHDNCCNNVGLTKESQLMQTKLSRSNFLLHQGYIHIYLIPGLCFIKL